MAVTTIGSIRCVEYTLHPTFPASEVTKVREDLDRVRHTGSFANSLNGITIAVVGVNSMTGSDSTSRNLITTTSAANHSGASTGITPHAITATQKIVSAWPEGKEQHLPPPPGGRWRRTLSLIA